MSNDINIKVSGTNTSGAALKTTKKDVDDLGDAAQKAAGKATELAVGEKAAAEGADKLGNKADSAKRDLGQLQIKIVETKAAMLSLAREFDKTADPKILKAYTQQTTALGKMGKIAKELAAAAPSGKGSLLTGAIPGVEGIGAMPTAGIIAAPVAAVGAIGAGAAIGGATIAAGGLAGVGLGVAGAAMSDPKIMREAQSQIDAIKTMWFDASKSFRAPTLEAVKILGDAVKGVDLDGMLSRAAKYVTPLASSIGSLIQSVAGGVGRLVDNAGPVMAVLIPGIADIGRAIEQAMSLIAGGSVGGAKALNDLLHLIEVLIVSGGLFIRWAENAYDAMDRFGNAINNFITGKPADAVDMIGKSLKGVGTEAARTADEIKALEDRFKNLFGIEMSLDQANLAVKQGMADLITNLQTGTRTLDENTQAGRDNVQGALDFIRTLEQQREANLNNKMTLDQANGAYQDQVVKLEGVMAKMGYTRAQIDALIGKYAQIPHEVSTDIRTTYHTAYYTTYSTDMGLGHQGGGKMRTGGILGAGAAAAGGIHSGLTKVGEEGSEYARLPTGTMVYPRSNTAQMDAQGAAQGSGGGSGGWSAIELRVTGGVDGVAELLNNMLRGGSLTAFAKA